MLTDRAETQREVVLEPVPLIKIPLKLILRLCEFLSFRAHIDKLPERSVSNNNNIKQTFVWARVGIRNVY